MTLDPQKLARVQTIVTHEGCPDGVASAILLHDALPHAEVVFRQYGTKALAELPATPGMLFCDVSPPAARVEEFVAAGAIVLDHHATARDVVLAFGADGIFADEAAEPGVSGAVLAYRHVWRSLVGDTATVPSPTEALTFACLAGVRDTWQTKDPEWLGACAQAEALRFFPWPAFASIRDPFGEGRLELRDKLQVGVTLLQKKSEDVARALARAYRFRTPKGTRVVVFQGLSLTSDAAEMTEAEADLIVGFGYEADSGVPKLILSTRSHTTFDCAAFAKQFGGGGHTRAAGVSIEINLDVHAFAASNPYDAIFDLVASHEAGSLP